MLKKKVRATGGIIIPPLNGQPQKIADAETIEVPVPAGEPPLWDVYTRPQVVGQPIPRIDGPIKVTGRARYTYDQLPAGLLHAVLVRSAHPHARLLSVDIAPAQKMPGVRAVIRLDSPDLMRASAASAAGNPEQAAAIRQAASHSQKSKTMLFVGDEIAAVAADTLEQAEDAARAIRIEYESLPFVTDVAAARQPDAPRVHAGQDNIRPLPSPHGPDGDRGDVHEGLAQADAVIETRYETNVAMQNALEPHGSVAWWDAPNHLTVWASTQGIFGFRGDLAHFFQMPASQVRVITDYLGGGFGAKFGAGIYGIAAAWLARETRAPVKLMLDRKAENLAVGNRPSSHQQLRLGAKKDGTLTAIEVVNFGTPGIGHGAGAGAASRRFYLCPNVSQRDHDVATNLGPAAAFRAPGWPQGAFALEQAMDELADKLQLDPLELRQKNYWDKPFKALRIQYEIGAARFGWRRRAQIAASNRNSGPVKRGLGMATSCWPTFGRPPAQARVVVHSDGAVEVTVGCQDIGGGMRMIAAQVTAEEFGLRPHQVRVHIGDTQPGIYGPASGGSVTTTAVAPAIRAAAYYARQKLLAAIAPRLGAAPESLRLRGGKLLGAPRALSFASACRLLRHATISAEADRAQNYEPHLTEMHGAQFAEVEVDTETGRIRVVKITAVHDCGRSMNRLLVESQVNGGIIMGLSYALLEGRVVDHPTGHVMNSNLDFYKLAGTREIPELDVVILDAIDPRGNNLDVKGIGEPVIVPTAAAIGNAVAHALGGLHIRELPMTPDRVLNALAAVRA